MAETWEARYTAEVWGPEEAGAVTSRSSPAAVGRCVADQLASALLPLWRAAYGKSGSPEMRVLVGSLAAKMVMCGSDCGRSSVEMRICNLMYIYIYIYI